MRDWKTTVGGIVAAAGIAFTQSDNPTLKTAGAIMTALGTVFFGYHASDK